MLNIRLLSFVCTCRDWSWYDAMKDLAQALPQDKAAVDYVTNVRRG